MSYASDDEQLENLKQWWRENGRSVIAGVVIALVAVIGWQQWNEYQRNRAEAASTEYMAFLEDIRKDGAGDAAVQRGQALIDKHGSTAYGPLTAFWLAQYHVEHDQLDQAAKQLRWALDNADSEAMRHVARLRLARVLLAQDKPADALALIEPAPAGAFASQYQELRGDILAAQGKRDEAIAAYRNALADKDLLGQRRGLIQLKLNDLGAAEEPVS